MLPNNENLRPVIMGGFGPPALACIRSWGMQGARVGMVCVQGEEGSRPESRFLADWALLPPRLLYTEEGICIVSSFLEEFRASGITCISEDTARWVNDHQHLLPAGVAVWNPPNDVIQIALSKMNQLEAARKVGLKTLHSYFIGKSFDVQSISAPHFPLCLRPSDPKALNPSFKVSLVGSPYELATFLQDITEIHEPIIGQPFMSLPNLVVHGTRTKTGEHIGIDAFLVERKFEGVTLTLRPTAIGPELKAKCAAFTDTFDLVGNYHFEFLFDPQDGRAYFLEINNRLGGTTAKVLACGYDEPAYALKAYGVSIRLRQGTRKVTVSNRQALLKYIHRSMTDRLTPLDYPSETKLTRLIKSLWAFGACRDEVFNLHDLRGSSAMYLGGLKARLTNNHHTRK